MAPTLIGPGDDTGSIRSANPVEFRWSGGHAGPQDHPADHTEFRVYYTIDGGSGKDVEAGRTKLPARELTVDMPVGLIKWRVEIRHGSQSCSSGSLKFRSVGTCTPPSVTATASKTSAVAGETITLTANAGGSSPQTITWFEGNTSIGSGATLTRTVTASTSFHCEVRNDCGTVQSATIAVNVCTPPSITTQPSSATINEGSTATLSVGVSGTQPVNVQWFSGSTAVGSGATFTTPTLTQTTTYRAEVTNGCGTVTSNTVTVTVTPACNPPAIATQPSSASVSEGTTATLSVGVTGTQPINIQWFSGSTPVGSGATFTTAPLTQTTTFRAEATNACGTVSSNTVTVTVTQTCTPPSIASQPVSTTIVEGATATLSIGVAGTQPVNIQWFSGSTPVGSGATFTTPALTQSTTYRAEAANACGTVSSNSVTVTVTQSCTPPAVVAPAGFTIEEGSTTTLSVSVAGSEPTDVKWFDGATLVGSGPSFTTPALTQTTVYRIEATNACGTASATITVDVQKRAACDGDVHAPLASVIAQARSAVPYEVAWPSLGVGISYEVEESTSSDFTNPRVFMTQATSMAFRHDVGTAERFFYRVRGVRVCDGRLGEYSGVLRVVVVPNPQVSGAGPDIVAAHGTLSIITQTMHLDAETLGGVGASFHIGASESWLSIHPSSGIVPAEGVTFTLTVDPRGLPQGTSAATLQIGNGGALRTEDDGTTRGVPVTISLVTPVRPAPRPADDSVLVIPAIAHAPGANSQWQSDVRIAHTWPVAMRYELTLTTTATNGSTGLQTVVTVPAGQTLALDDLVGRWFGAGALGDGVTGLLLVRQADNAVVPGRTVATSRLYNKAANGSFGQFVAAVPLSKFVAGGARALSMTQIAQSDAFRTNFGIVEGSGNAARVKIEAFDQAGAKLFESMLDLMPGEHRQLGAYLAANNVTTANARVNVSVVSPKGRAYAYASVVDNKTGDPSFIPAFSTSNATSHVIAGAADLATPTGRWQTDLRLFNASDASVPATLEYYPQGSSTPTATRELTLQPGEVRATDDVLRDLFGLSSTGGAIRIKSAIAGALVPTARTYHNRGDGTYGQFIRGVSSDEALALGEQPRMILNAEESPRFRTNVGLVEVNGADTNVELTVTLPGRRVTSTVQVQLKANEYRQLNSMLRTMGMSDAYNATVSVRVMGGNGKVVAFGSVVDNVTQDPTYVVAE
ncbi:MAG TPA: hypothetical protein VGF69_11450 [Thermoanaerobaculia bacterium]